MSSRVVVIHIIVVNDGQNVRVVSRLTTGHIGSDAVVSRTGERRLEDPCGACGQCGGIDVSVYMIV